jgi:hypothetical protein
MVKAKNRTKQRKLPKKKTLKKRQSSRSPRKEIPIAGLSNRSENARDRAMHAIAWKRRNPEQPMTTAAKLSGVGLATIRKNFPSALRKVGGKLQVTATDRYSKTFYVPDENGNPVPVHTRSSKDRKALSGYLRALGRYLGGKRNAMAPWRGKTIAGVALVTSRDVLVLIEDALSDFSLYRSKNGGS